MNNVSDWAHRQVNGLTRDHRSPFPVPTGLHVTLTLGGEPKRTLEVEMYFDEECLEPIGARVGTLVLNEDQAHCLLMLLREFDEPLSNSPNISPS